MPLRSVQPAQTIPSPVSPLSGMSLTFPAEPPLQSPSAFSPTTERTVSTPHSTFDTIASKTPLLHNDSVLPALEPASRLVNPASTSYTQQDQTGSSMLDQETPFSRQLGSTGQATSSARVSTHTAQALPPPSLHIPKPTAPQSPSSLQIPVEQAALKDGLGKSSNPGHIFDLDAKVHLGSGKYLPSSFRHRIPDQAAPIPERSSSHLSSPISPAKFAATKETWSAEDPSSIPLLPPSPVAETKGVSPSTQYEAAKWKTLLDGEIAQGAVCSNEDAHLLPISADDVFKRDAAPIHLPALEEYLKNPIIFGEPIFTDSRLVCTEQELELFDLGDEVSLESYNDSAQSSKIPSPSPDSSQINKRRVNSKHGSRIGQLEVAGGQISCPASLYASSVDTRAGASGRDIVRCRRGAGRSKQLPHAAESSKSHRKSKKEASSEAADPLLTLVTTKEMKLKDDHDDAIDDKQALEIDDDDATLVAEDTVQAEKVASRISARLSESRQSGPRSGLSEPPSEGVSSKFSTHASPVTRKEMFPPLMLLKENSLDELKSNAIGPRRPPVASGQ